MNEYEDIIHLSHHVSMKHPQMSMQDRAAQFSPFAALTGFHAAVEEAARQAASSEDSRTSAGADDFGEC